MSDFPVAAPPPPSGMSAGTPATFAQRLIAVLIDFAIVLAAFIPALIVVLIAGQISGVLGFLAGLGLYVLVFAAALYMYIGGIGTTGQTPGKRMQGVKVVDDNGGMLGMGGAAVRYIVSAIFNSILCGLPVGSLWMLFDSEKKTLYDKVLNDQAIQVEPGELLPIFPEGKPF